MHKLIEMLAKALLLPLIKEGIAYLAKLIKDYQKKKEQDRVRTQTIEQAGKDEDQRPIEEQVKPGEGGKPSGHGRVVSKLPWKL